MKTLNRVTTALSSAIVYATVVAPAAFASNTETINPCPEGSYFDELCTGDQFSDPSSVVQTIVALLLLAAVLVALFFLIYGGIKWILSGGDKGKVDAARSTIVGAIIGLVIALAAFFVLNLVAQVFNLGPITDLDIPTF